MGYQNGNVDGRDIFAILGILLMSSKEMAEIGGSCYPYVQMSEKAPEAMLQRWQKLVAEHDAEKALNVC